MGQKPITIGLPNDDLAYLEECVALGRFPNRSEALRQIVSAFLRKTEDLHDPFCRPETPQIITVSFTKALVDQLNALATTSYPSRSEIVREAIRDWRAGLQTAVPPIPIPIQPTVVTDPNVIEFVNADGSKKIVRVIKK